MLNSPPGVNSQAHPMQGANLRVARLDRNRRRFRTRGWGCGLQGLGMPANSFLMGLAKRYQIKHHLPQKPGGKISNSDLEMASLLLLWLVIEGMCGNLRKKQITIFGNNVPTVSWVKWLASRKSIVAENLIQALALRLKVNHSCPLTPMHIEGRRNAISDAPSHSFGSNPAWECISDSD